MSKVRRLSRIESCVTLNEEQAQYDKDLRFGYHLPSVSTAALWHAVRSVLEGIEMLPEFAAEFDRPIPEDPNKQLLLRAQEYATTQARLRRDPDSPLGIDDKWLAKQLSHWVEEASKLTDQPLNSLEAVDEFFTARHQQKQASKARLST